MGVERLGEQVGPLDEEVDVGHGVLELARLEGAVAQLARAQRGVGLEGGGGGGLEKGARGIGVGLERGWG